MFRLIPYGHSKRTWEKLLVSIITKKKHILPWNIHPDSHYLLPSAHYMPFLNPLSFIFSPLSFKFIEKSVYFEYTLSWIHEWVLGKVKDIILKYYSLNFKYAYCGSY